MGLDLVTCTTFVLADCDLDLALMWDQVINADTLSHKVCQSNELCQSHAEWRELARIQ